MEKIEIVEACNQAQLEEIRALFQEYATLVQNTVDGYSCGATGKEKEETQVARLA